MEQLRALEKELTQVSNTADEEEWNRIVEQAETVKVSGMLLLYISGKHLRRKHQHFCNYFFSSSLVL